MKKYQNPIIKLLEFSENDVLSISAQNSADSLIKFDDVASML